MTCKNKALDLIEAARQKEAEHNEINNKMYAQLRELYIARDKAIREYIFVDRLLDACTWNLAVHGKAVMLVASELSDDSVMKTLAKLTESSYHCQFDLVETGEGLDKHELVSLRYDDGDVTIRFDNNNLVAPFIAKTGLRIHTSKIDEDIARLSDAANVLRQLKALAQPTPGSV